MHNDDKSIHRVHDLLGIEKPITPKHLNIVNVLDYGAVGDGKTDNTVAFRRAFNEAKERKAITVFIPYGEYVLDGFVDLYSNTTIISNHAILRKRYGNRSYKIFAGRSHGKLGYGSGANNILIKGIKIKGEFGSSPDVSTGASITLNHSDNVKIVDCIFEESIVGGHAIDLAGCRHIYISDSVFSGSFTPKGREYNEAIQIDNSTAEGIGDEVVYDGLPCVDVTVERCRFIPYVQGAKEIPDYSVGARKFPSPNPFGSHSRVGYHYFDKISFLNNYVEGGFPSGDGTNGTSTYSSGWLHFYHVKNLVIKGNKFINTVRGQNARVLGLYSSLTHMPESEVNNPHPTFVNYDGVSVENVLFTENEIIGFDQREIDRLIFIQGREHLIFRNIEISSNTFKDCFSEGETDNACANLIYAYWVDNLRVNFNSCENVRRLLDVFDSTKIQMSHNVFNGVMWGALDCTRCVDVSVLNNTLDDYGLGLYFINVKGLVVSGNNFRNERDEALQIYTQIISINTCSQFSLFGNMIMSKKSIPIGINVYNESNDGDVFRNITLNINTPVGIGPNTVDIRT